MKNVNVPIFFQQSSNFLHQGVARTTFCRINFDYMINYYRVDVQLNNFTLLTTIYSSPFLPTLSTTLLQKHYKYIPTNLTSMPGTHPGYTEWYLHIPSYVYSYKLHPYPSASTGSFQPTRHTSQGNFVTILFAFFAWWYSLI
jgi:hypothetical protein